MKSQTLKFISLTTGAKDEDEELMSGIRGAKDLGMLCLTDAACATLDGKLLSRIRGPSLFLFTKLDIPNPEVAGRGMCALLGVISKGL